ncbi:MAG: hypothetical protein U0W24_12305 [Bacteroidales bacterium]
MKIKRISNMIKSFFGSIVFIIIAAGFMMLVRFEIKNGVAGGKFGGVELISMPGTFWFLIGMQVLLGLYLIVYVLKETWNLFHKFNSNSKTKKNKEPAKLIAIFWLSFAVYLIMIIILAFWSVIEQLIRMYNLSQDIEMQKKAVLGGLFIICIIVFCSVIYRFLILSLIDNLYPKVKNSYRLLRKKRS